ncbi:MAG: hypothetical protein K2J10_09720, partial [Muribaculaceae bacterium]|nr:hypothetical protein [Muribaculaceae bacterium]
MSRLIGIAFIAIFFIMGGAAVCPWYMWIVFGFLCLFTLAGVSKSLQTILGLILIIFSFSSGNNWACGSSEKNWSGSYVRYSGDNPIYENWDICVNSDGTCTAVNTGSGFKSYTHKYSGSWTPVSDDVIKLSMSSTYGSNMTRSYGAIDNEANRAQTQWKRSQVYA